MPFHFFLTCLFALNVGEKCCVIFEQFNIVAIPSIIIIFFTDIVNFDERNFSDENCRFVLLEVSAFSIDSMK